MAEIYRIELSKQQLIVLKDVIYRHYRLMLGQLHIGLRDVLLEASERHYPNRDEEKTEEKVDEVISQLRLDFWNQTNGKYNGVGYSEYTDMLIDMEEVIRHQLFLDSGRSRMGQVDEQPAFHWNKGQSLIKVYKVK